MAEFKLERFKYAWKGEWSTGTAYKRDDVVRVSGKSYVCVVGHVASSIFADDLDAILPGSVPPQPQPKWVVMTSGASFTGDWLSGTDYNLGDIVKVGGTLWICSVNHTATTFADNSDYWITFSNTIFVGTWAESTSYAPGQVVKYNGNLHKCVTAHISSTLLEDNADDWELYFDGISWRDDYLSTNTYRVNDFVKYGGSVYRCTETHVAGNVLDNSKFNIEIVGFQSEGQWTSTTNYNVGDIVRHHGYLYLAVESNTDSKPYNDNGNSDWVLLSKSINFVGEWSVTDSYLTGDVVLRGGNLYLALRDIGSGEVDGSTLDYLEDDFWELLVPGKKWSGNWTNGTYYNIGDIVIYKGTSYVCTFEHEASFVNFPGDNGSGYNYWDILMQAGRPAGLETKGDLLTYGQNRLLDNDGSTVLDDSSFGDTNLAIGESEQLLSVTSDLELYWRDIQEDADSVFVATNGIDAEGRGSYQKPFRTIRYAAEYVDDNYTAGSPVIIRVTTGKYEEVSPIVVPAGCAINGDELRSTTVIANSAKASYQDQYQYIEEYLTHFTSIMLDIVTAQPITPQAGNTVSQVTEVFEESIDENGDIILVTDSFPTSTIDGVNAVLGLIDDYKNYIEFNIGDGETNPTLSGSNTPEIVSVIVSAGEALFLNRNFIAQELLQYIKNNNTDITFNDDQIKSDILHLLRAIKLDTYNTGNYATLLSAQRFANSVNGSQASNLFYMRDSTGLRDLSTGGLQGVLNPPGVFELYQKPTGGALVSFDPGWGPDDERTWITTRSPYVQGVTNTGTACVGIKIDGSLHSNGYKSMVANDFTQVLSDGIGVWVTNNARAELVSIFTYYCQIGYFAEDGGIIRAANGNNSYGAYGSIADGIDDSETPQTVAAYNYNNEALVSEAFAGGSNDELKIFEYANAGEQYTSADATIVGAGANADVEYSDFRDGGLFEARLTSPDGSSASGGAGFLRRQGSAQETLDATSTLKLSATDVTQFENEILGMRVIVYGGTGVGQYGYITGFTFATKEIEVARESDDQAGWDHIIPGTPLVAQFDLTTRYRIEPRVTVPAPSFSSTSENLFTNRTYVDMEFGTITESYNGITAGGNVIWRDDAQVRVLLSSIISNTALQFTGQFATDPVLPLEIRGRTSGTTATIQTISANTGDIIEVNIDAGGSSFTVGEEFDLLYTAGSGDTFDGAASAATFNITRNGTSYSVTLVDGGSGYSENDKITILGTALGGATPDNDLTITVSTVSDDSTSSILTFTSVGTGRGGRFVSLTSTENARWSDDGSLWNEVTLPLADYKKLLHGNNRFIAVSHGTNAAAYSLDGKVWATDNGTLPEQADWNDGVYGNGKFVIVAAGSDTVAVSSDGDTWTAGNIPDDTDGGLDSTTSIWSYVTYGIGKYVAVSTSDRATATSTDGVTWTRHDTATPDFSTETIVSVEYGNNRFVIITDAGSTAYSFDGITWTAGNSLGITDFVVKDMKYNQGLFVAIGKDAASGSDQIATSEYGITWIARSLSSTQDWSAITYGNGNWFIKASAATTDALNVVQMGAKAFIRAEVGVGSIEEIRILDPGSGYDDQLPPDVTIVDPNYTFAAAFETRIGDGVLAQPDFINRGAGYRNATSTITVTGNGFADVIPVGNTLTVSGVQNIPGPGVQIQIEGIEDPNAIVPGTLAIFSGVTVEDLGDDGLGNETNLVRFQISPRLDVQFKVETGTSITLRERFSQCRLSGHDFLDIGTGNFEETNYPTIYASGAFFTALPENEIYEANNGRVYYVSTDQDGNFRTGELFSVQQATGIVTISAEFFDLDGLSELSLGGVRLGGSGTVVNEFSTDSTFAADSNNVIPTQRAIATFLADRLSVGGEALEVNKLQAGRVLVGGLPENELNTNTGQQLKIVSDVVFDGTYETNDGAGNITTHQTNVSGTIISQMLFLNINDNTMQ